MADNIKLDDLQIDIVVNSEAASSSLKALAGNLRDAGKAGKEFAKGADRASSKAQNLGKKLAESNQVAKEGGKSLKKFGDYAKAAASGIKSLGSKLGSYLGGKVSSGISEISSKIKTIFSSIGRIAFYRLIRSAIKGITQAVREGLSLLIEWDRTFGENTSLAARTADEISAKWTEVKKSLGAAAMPLIQIVQPALMQVMNTAIACANAVNQIFRTIQGYSTYMKATQQSIGDSAKKVSGAVKELKRVVFGFDELNILPSDNPSGGGADDSNVGELDFVETDIADVFKGKLSDIINNLVESINPVALGKTVSEKINKGIDYVNSFLKDTNFLQIGQKIGTFLTTAFSKIDWDGLGQIFVRRITAIPTILIGAIQRISLGEVGSAIFKFLKGAIDTAVEWIKNIDWFSTIYGFFSQIGNMIVKLHPIELVGKVLKFVWNVAKAVVEGLAGAFIGLLKSSFDIAGAVINWLREGWKSIGEWANENIYKPVGKFFSAIGQTVEYIVDYIFHPSKWGTDFSAGLKKIWSDAFGVVTEEQTKLQNYLNQRPLAVQLKVDASGAAKTLTLTLNGWQSKIDSQSGLILPLTPEEGYSKTNTQFRRQPYFLPTFASGGLVPNTGSLFVAGEQGTEIVSDLGSHTGVMNVNQMQEAVASGNVELINALYAVGNMINATVNSKSFDIYMDSSKVGRSVSTYQNNQARRGITQGAY